MINASALHRVLAVLTGWLDRQERHAVAYLIEENRILRRYLGGKRLTFTDTAGAVPFEGAPFTVNANRVPGLNAESAAKQLYRNFDHVAPRHVRVELWIPESQ